MTWCPILIGAIAILTSATTFGMTFTPEGLARQLAKTELEADIEVESIQGFVGQDQMLSTRATATILAVHRSTLNDIPRDGSQIQIVSLGGEVGEVGLFLTGYPRPYAGIKYHAHLVRSPSLPGTYEITGFDSGLTPLTPMRNYSRNRTDGSNGSGSGPFLYWDDAFFPIPYFISAPSFLGHEDFVAAIDAGFTSWREPGDIKVDFISMGCSSSVKNENDGINNIIYVARDWPFNSDAIAITRNFYIATSATRAGLILDSDILLNGEDHEFTTTNETGHHDVQNILTHEIGHFLGLGHEVTPKNVNASMYEVAQANELVKRNLHSSDLAGIRAAYTGTSMKVGLVDSKCMVGNGSVSCLSVHSGKARPSSILYLVAFLIVTLSAGRLYRRKWTT